MCVYVRARTQCPCVQVCEHMWRPKINLSVAPLEPWVWRQVLSWSPRSREPQGLLSLPPQGWGYKLAPLCLALNNRTWHGSWRLSPGPQACSRHSVPAGLSPVLLFLSHWIFLFLLLFFCPPSSPTFFPVSDRPGWPHTGLFAAEAGLHSWSPCFCCLSAGISGMCRHAGLTLVLRVFILTHVNLLYKSSITFGKVLESVPLFIEFTKCTFKCLIQCVRLKASVWERQVLCANTRHLECFAEAVEELKGEHVGEALGDGFSKQGV